MNLRDQAEQRFASALEATGARDPRPFYRDQLKALKDEDPAAFRQATEYYETTLLPALASEQSDPLGEWLEYGRMIVALRVEGSTVRIDATGRSRPYSRPVGLDELVLHLPTSTRQRAIPVGIPAELSAPQRATFDLLVRQATDR